MKAVITGACGFVGTNASLEFIRRGYTVVGVDDLSRSGTEQNLKLLRERAPGKFIFARCDVRDDAALSGVFAQHFDAEVVLHLAAQVAATTSVIEPRYDFEVNALGTLNALEATRASCPGATFLFSSTNKVYGNLDQFDIQQRDTRYAFANLPQGVSEAFPLDFYSPYGCSKGAADQYVRDYARIYGLKTVVFRQSCIYGTNQWGMEDQGWIAWFIIATLLGRPLTLYGDGRQVRDVLWVEDLVELYFRAIENIEVAKGQVYNAGGGPQNTYSLLELLDQIAGLTGEPVSFKTSNWRPGDQKVFICDITKAKQELGWAPKVNPQTGVARLFEWVQNNREFIEKVVGKSELITR